MTYDDSDLPADDSLDAIPDPVTAGHGYIEDFISGQMVRATPEESDAVQVFARRLVEDYGYPKANIRTARNGACGHPPNTRDLGCLDLPGML